MGADLIGYMVIGPKGINLGADDFGSYFDEHSTQHPDAKVGDPKVMIPEDLDQWPNDEDGLDREAFVKACEQFVEFWDGEGARDCCFRCLPGAENRKVGFAGEMSWGDAPGGLGYECFDFVAKYDLWEFFGLE